MLDDFFTRAILAAIGVALIAGPLGCFIVWKRLAYFGDTLAHAALLGAAIAFLFDINLTLAIFIVSTLVALSLLLLQNRISISADAILGLISHSSLALGLVVLSFLTWIRFDLMGLLFGDILAVSTVDVYLIWVGGAFIMALLILIWRPLFAATVNKELAKAEGTNPEFYELVFMLLMAAIIAIAIKVVGVLLITALLIIPAASARRFSSSPEMMAIIAAIIGTGASVFGLWGSLEWDTPAGPSIVMAAFFIFILAVSPLGNLIRQIKNLYTHSREELR